MRFSIVFRILGLLSVFVGCAMLLPIPFSLYYGDKDYIPLLISSGIALSFGMLGFITTKKKSNLRPKEGFAVVTLGWIVLSGFGCLPFLISGEIPSFTDAFYETMSGFTTTGATILTDIEKLPHGLLFWRSLTHWFGGMGIIVLSLAILPFLGIGGMQLFKAESPGPVVDKLTPRITETAKILWGVYMLFSLLETILLYLGGMSLFDALCHTFGTMATGGFSTKNASVAAFDSAYIDYVIIFFMIVAGTNFSLHFRLLSRDFKSFSRNSEFKFYISIILIVTVLIGIDIYINHYSDAFDSIRFSLFQVVSILTTTGYGTADYETWSVTSQMLLFFIMFIGGCAGSTGGGIKVMRIFVLFKFVKTELIRLIHPQAVVKTKMGGTVIDRKVMINIAGFFVLHMLITLIGTLLVSTMVPDIETAFGAVVANLNNIGPGLGLVGPTDNYAFFPDIGKWLLSFLMLVGRLEIFTVIVLLVPSFWRK